MCPHAANRAAFARTRNIRRSANAIRLRHRIAQQLDDRWLSSAYSIEMVDRRPAAGYLIIQGIAGAAWWVLLFTSEAVRNLFFVDVTGWEAGRTILLADLLMFAGASLVSGYLIATESKLARPATWATIGATTYATLVALGWVFGGIGHLLGFVVMVLSLGLTVVASTALGSPWVESEAVAS